MAHVAHWDQNGKRVPSVTTVLVRDNRNLIGWAGKTNRENVIQAAVDCYKAKDWKPTLKQLLRAMHQAPDQYGVRDKAAEAGSLAHDLFELTANKKELPKWVADPATLLKGEEELDEKRQVLLVECRHMAVKAHEAFCNWMDQTQIELRDAEVSVTDNEYRYGGTYDADGVLPDGSYALIDYKTGSGIYPEMIVQVAAYARLWKLQNPDDELSQIHIIRTGKKFGDFHHHCYPREVFHVGWNAFRIMRELYDINAELRALLK